MTARMRRLASDWEQVRKDFAGHSNIIVAPVGEEPPEKYHVTYFVNGIYLLPDGSVQTLARHEVEITLHAEYPRYKPICRILTPIWHPNFRDGQICIGDIWGAGESLSDIIVNIGDMIQYKSWNSFSPLSADAAKWAIENKHLFPVGNIELNIADYASAKDSVEIDLFSEDGEIIAEEPAAEETVLSGETEVLSEATEVLSSETEGTPSEIPADAETPVFADAPADDGNDFEITAEELEGIVFVPTAQRMQTMQQTVKGGKINFKTILMKGLLWALIGSFLGFGFSEITDGIVNESTAADLMGHSYLAEYYEYYDKAMDAYDEDDMSSATYYYGLAEEALYDAYQYDFDEDMDDLEDAIQSVLRLSTAFWSALVALFIGLFLGLGEGIFYGSAANAFKYGGIGAGISAGIGFVSGYIAQFLYAEMLTGDSSTFMAAFTRGLGWAIMGAGVGLAIGLIKPAGKRILFCLLGGLAGGFTGGFLFNYICDIIPNDVVARGVAIVIMGLLIGLGVGLLEQVAKQAWLKVIRGEFEGKEYLVFAGTTSIGNTGKNTIVLFKDKLVGPHHCDIILEGNKYVLVDCGTPMGTVVNGMRIQRHVLRHGDAIALGNSVLVFNTK